MTRTTMVLTALALAGAACGDDATAPPAGGDPHDGSAPVLTLVSPAPGTPTAGQSGFTIRIAFSDEGSGVDPATFTLRSDRALGGAYLESGRLSAAFQPGTNLAPLFAVDGAGAQLLVADSAALAPGPTRLTATVRDRAGNTATASWTVSVSADPDALLATHVQAAPGAGGIALDLGLRNGGPVAGLQFDLPLNPAVVASVDSAFVGGRAAALDDGRFDRLADGTLRVVILDTGGAAVEPGQGPVLRFFVTLRATAPAGAYALAPAAVVLSDRHGASRPAAARSAILRVAP